jgi:hypothetical protein
MVYNKPAYLLGIALIGGLINGSNMPLFAGLVLAKVLSLLSVPLSVIGTMFPGEDPMVALEREVNFYAGLMGVFGFVACIAAFS